MDDEQTFSFARFDVLTAAPTDRKYDEAMRPRE
jgi:hypothetical protein